jgi:hypothetical protein
MAEDNSDYETYRGYCLAHKPKRCEICGDEETVLVHHLDGNRDNNKLENLVPLCPSHHSRVHWGYEEYSEYVEHLPETSLYAHSSTLPMEKVTVFFIEKMLRGSHKTTIGTAVNKYLQSHEQGRGKTLIDDMLKDRAAPIEGYGGGGRQNIRLTSVEAAVEYLKDNDGNVPFGYD